MHTKSLKLGISEAALLDAIMKDPLQRRDRQFQPGPAPASALFAQHDRAGLLASLREQNLRQQILATVGEVVSAPSMLADALNTYNNETRTPRHADAGKRGRKHSRSER